MGRVGRICRFDCRLKTFPLHFRHLTDLMFIARASQDDQSARRDCGAMARSKSHRRRTLIAASDGAR
jgi:hypothetical protein